jgi:hypothetical protein
LATLRRSNVTIKPLRHRGLLACAAALVAVGCATAPPPNEQLAVAKDSVQRAETAGAVDLAPVEMAAARDKLTRAEQAAAHRDAVPATELAEQADVDAKLAEATAQEHKSHKAAMELDASLQALRNEATRDQQSTQ